MEAKAKQIALHLVMGQYQLYCEKLPFESPELRPESFGDWLDIEIFSNRYDLASKRADRQLLYIARNEYKAFLNELNQAIAEL